MKYIPYIVQYNPCCFRSRESFSCLHPQCTGWSSCVLESTDSQILLSTWQLWDHRLFTRWHHCKYCNLLTFSFTVYMTVTWLVGIICKYCKQKTHNVQLLIVKSLDTILHQPENNIKVTALVSIGILWLIPHHNSVVNNFYIIHIPSNSLFSSFSPKCL